MSLVLRYEFNQPTASLATDSSGNGYTLTNNRVVSANDATYGPVASFDGVAAMGVLLTLPNAPTEFIGTVPVTVSFHVKFTSLTSPYFQPFNMNTLRLGLADGSTSNRIWVPTSLSFNFAFSSNTWYHIALTYDGGSPGTVSVYADGVFVYSTPATINFADSPISIGSNVAGGFVLDGFMSDFRMYDAALSATEIATLHSVGPNPVTLAATMYTHVADLVWVQASGASEYTLTYSQDSGPETTVTTTSGLSHTLYDLTPGSSYEFNIYSDLDTSTPVYTITESSLAVNTVNITSLMTRLGNDLTLINSTSVDDIESLLSTALTAGDIVKTPLGSTKFIDNAGTFDVDGAYDAVLTSFDPSSGSGQNISVLLPDTSTAVISYDENTNQVASGGTSYSSDVPFVLGTYKVTFKEF